MTYLIVYVALAVLFAYGIIELSLGFRENLNKKDYFIISVLSLFFPVFVLTFIYYYIKERFQS
jgi:hypothetical protein